MKLDLHTHSIASYDGGVSPEQYRQVLKSGMLDVIAVTDHNRIDMAQELNKEWRERVIIGEEIMTLKGEIIGLFLTEPIKPGQTPFETAKQIKEQGGLVYIPHPFETVRKGLDPRALDELVEYIDIIEVVNGRAFAQNRGSKAMVWSRLNHKVGAASSDAHGIKGLSRTYTTVSDAPTRDTVLELLRHASLITARPRAHALLYPKYHRLRKKLKGQK